MGYKIRVDHSRFNAAADSIDKYISTLNKEMKKSDSSVSNMLGLWKGTDATAFSNKWSVIMGSGSTYMNFKKSLESYAKYLRYAGNQYKNAQANAINRANRLPKW